MEINSYLQLPYCLRTQKDYWQLMFKTFCDQCGIWQLLNQFLMGILILLYYYFKIWIYSSFLFLFLSIIFPFYLWFFFIFSSTFSSDIIVLIRMLLKEKKKKIYNDYFWIPFCLFQQDEWISYWSIRVISRIYKLILEKYEALFGYRIEEIRLQGFMICCLLQLKQRRKKSIRC